METASDRFQGFLKLVSCYDFRLEDIPDPDPGRKGERLPKTTKYWYVERLRDLAAAGEVFVMHLSYLKPLGVRVAFGVKRAPDVAKRLLELEYFDNEIAERLGFPLPYLLDLVSVLDRGRVFASWYIPPGIDPNHVMGWSDEMALGYKVPVATCTPKPSWRNLEKLGSRLEELLNMPEVNLKTPVVAYMLLAVLDKFELLTIDRMSKVSNILKARDLDVMYGEVDVKLKRRYVMRYYTMLSSRGMIGRIRVVPRSLLSYPQVLVLTSSRFAPMLYGAMAVKGFAGHIYYSKDKVAVASLMDSDVQGLLRSTMKDYDHEYGMRYRTFFFPFPYELYNPIENRWYTTPVEGFLELLKKLRLIST
ncbi:hypothetical protein [Stetteria hydrogenophila]